MKKSKYQKKRKKSLSEKAFWGIVDFPVELRKKICAIAECKNITVSALMEEVCGEFVNRKEIKELLAKEYIWD
jgi:hypothetical protein